ncbi:MAG: thioredoxin domain-containing protein [Candidatus Limnocylindrales bacterium]
MRERPRIAIRPATRAIWRSPMVLVTAAAVLLAVAVIALNMKAAPGPVSGDLAIPPSVYAADMVDGASLGSADARVVMEVWSDFQCPICARLVREQFPGLKTRFVDTGLLRIQARDIAILGHGAPDESLELATGAACAARQDRYWAFHDLAFWNQGGENRGDHSPEFIASLATQAGVDRVAWDACIAAPDTRAGIRTATIEALGRGINATPTIALNGEGPLAGLPDATVLTAKIQALVDAAAAASPAGPATSGGAAAP